MKLADSGLGIINGSPITNTFNDHCLYSDEFCKDKDAQLNQSVDLLLTQTSLSSLPGFSRFN